MQFPGHRLGRYSAEAALGFCAVSRRPPDVSGLGMNAKGELGLRRAVTWGSLVMRGSLLARGMQGTSALSFRIWVAELWVFMCSVPLVGLGKK